MKVKDVMTPNAKAIWLTESLADAAKLMWENDCGVLPIIKDGRKVLGMITDRDTPDDDVDQALQLMQEHKIRRLPVVNPEGELEGILSMNDIVLHAKSAKASPVAYADIVKTYQAICEHPPEAAAAAAPA
jgi:CBS domain-containing protein